MDKKKKEKDLACIMGHGIYLCKHVCIARGLYLRSENDLHSMVSVVHRENDNTVGVVCSKLRITPLSWWVWPTANLK